MAEAAGLVLAILPLLISTVEHYEDCLKPIQRLCQFTTQAQRFCKLFGIQKTIFRNQCQLLLQNVLEQEDAHKMMIDQKHPTWTDTKVSAQLEEQLDASRDSCVCVIEEIRAVLRRLQIWSSELNGAIEQEGKACSKSSNQKTAANNNDYRVIALEAEHGGPSLELSSSSPSQNRPVRPHLRN